MLQAAAGCGGSLHRQAAARVLAKARERPAPLSGKYSRAVDSRLPALRIERGAHAVQHRAWVRDVRDLPALLA
jgi:hypothetical protein